MDIVNNNTPPEWVPGQIIVHVSATLTSPERDILVMETPFGLIAMFGYFKTETEWRFRVIPNEFHSPEALEAIQIFLLDTYGATLRAVTGDTITSREAWKQVPQHQPPAPLGN